jgi:hypothetical protein
MQIPPSAVAAGNHFAPRLRELPKTFACPAKDGMHSLGSKAGRANTIAELVT